MSNSPELESSFGQLLAYKKAKEIIQGLNNGSTFDLKSLTYLVESLNTEVDFTDALWGALHNRDFIVFRCIEDATVKFLNYEIDQLAEIDPEMVETRKDQLAMIKRIRQNIQELVHGEREK